jgi:hypothetical protein
MQIQAILLLFVASVSAWVSTTPRESVSRDLYSKIQQCFDHDEHFTTNHAQLGEGGDPNNQWGYCPNKAGCCADGKTWYACKNVSHDSLVHVRVVR